MTLTYDGCNRDAGDRYASTEEVMPMPETLTYGSLFFGY